MGKITIVLICLISAVPAFSRVLTPEEALERLLQSAPVRLKSKSSHLDAYDLIYTHSNGNRPFAYLFSSAQDGFMLVSADDNACPLLGYGDSELSKEAIPEHLIRWMEQYGNEIEMASGHENKRMRKTSSKRPHRQPIAPLCKTLWGMGYPYNEECPVFEGKHAETGGLATAMAQVMKYHNWPERGTGSNSYVCEGQELSIDFADHPFDWGNMKDFYSKAEGEDDEASIKAVSDLMYACGMSLDMGYTQYKSWVNAYRLPERMIKYFNYSPASTFKERKYYGLYDWEGVVYQSIEHNAPVVYLAQASFGELSFVCDGYDGEGYFHVNWGLDGKADGYYLLTALTPTTPQGTPALVGVNQNFAINHMALVEALPAREGDMPMTEVYNVKSISCEYDHDSGNLTVSGPFRYMGSVPQSLEFGIEVEDPNGNSIIYYSENKPTMGYSELLESISIRFFPAGDGVYKIYPVVTDDKSGQPKRIPASFDEMEEAEMTIKDKKVSFFVDSVPPVVVKNLKLNTPLYMSTGFEVEFDLENPSHKDQIQEYWVRIKMQEEDGLSWSCHSEVATLSPGETRHITYQSEMGIFFNVPVPVDVLIGVVREDRDRNFVFMGEPIDTMLSVIPGKYVFRGDNLVVENADNADPSDMSFSFDLSVEDGYYSYKIWATIFDAATDEIVYGQSMPGYVFCKEGDTVNVKRSFRNLELKGDTDYILRVYWDDRFFPPEAIGHLAECKFRTKTSGIENVYGDYGQEAVRISGNGQCLVIESNAGGLGYSVYAVDGEVVAAGKTGAGETRVALPEGIYLVRAGGRMAKIRL